MTCEHDFIWRITDCDERGWECCACKFKPGEEPGYEPRLDKKLIRAKVDGILLELHTAKFLYVSNNDMGDGVAANVTAKCKRLGVFDQLSIIRFIAEEMDHSKFWKERGDAIRAGLDPRRRCECGKIATAFIGAKQYCGEHSNQELPF